MYKSNGKKRPLEILSELDKTIQQVLAQPISDFYEKIFSEYSYRFCLNRGCHRTIRQELEFLNSGYKGVT